MGIKQLFNLIQKKAPNAYRNIALEVYSSKQVACDASQVLYQFVVATTTSGEFGVQALVDANGAPTGHLTGFAYRSLLMLEAGVRPVWVFDGTPPELKRRELGRRRAVKAEAREKEVEARETGTAEEERKYHTRGTKITPEMVEDSKRLLELMGLPVVSAPGEAEAQCAQLLREGRVAAVVSEDMDCLTLGAEVLLRNVGARKEPITEIVLADVLAGMGFTQEQFVDLSILCGCDYCETIGNLGPVGAFKLIEQHGSIEAVLAELEREEATRRAEGLPPRYTIPAPEQFDFVAARALFRAPDVARGLPAARLGLPDEAGLHAFLVDGKGFTPQRVAAIVARLRQAIAAKPQATLEAFLGRPRKSTPAGGKQVLQKSTPRQKRIKSMKG